MKYLFTYIEKFHFKNLLAFFLLWRLLDLLEQHSNLRDLVIVVMTLVIKHYFDSNTGAQKRDETISKALQQAQQSPALPVVTNADTVNVDAGKP